MPMHGHTRAQNIPYVRDDRKATEKATKGLTERVKLWQLEKHWHRERKNGKLEVVDGEQLKW